MSERSDVFDRATVLEEQQREDSIARVRRAVAEVGMGGRVVTLHCLDCGEHIEPARIRAVRGVTTCIDCARLNEQKLKNRNSTTAERTP